METRTETLVVHRSAHDVGFTLDRIAAALKAAGGTVFARIDHAAEAAKAGLELRPTQVLIWGNPKAGTGFMQASQTIGIDLPLRFLAWEDAGGTTYLAYTPIARLAERYGITGREAQAAAIDGTQQKLAESAVAF